MIKISMVIPCYGSEQTIVSVVNDIKELMKTKLKKYLYEIILVNDGSPDNVHDVIVKSFKMDDKIKYVRLAKNFSQHNAVMAGLNHAGGNIIICLDDDGQTPISEIPNLINALDEDCDVVYAKYEEKKHSKFRNIGSKINDYMLKIMLGKPKDLYISSFFAMKSYIKDEMIKYQNPYPYLGGLILRITNRIKNVKTKHCERANGKSNYNFKKLLSLYVNGLTNFSVKPLRVSAAISTVLILIALLVSIYLAIKKIMNPSIPIGWTSIVICILLVGASITFILGIIGEYVGRIYISLNKMNCFLKCIYL